MGIGKNIKQIRLKNKLTQKQLGEKCGMADSAIRRYELEKANPKIETLKKIADALNVSITDLDDRPEFVTTHLENELKILNQKKLDELNQIPTEEWFGEKWNQIREKYDNQKAAIQKKINALPKPEKAINKESFSSYPGERIKLIREKEGMSQETLSALANIPLSLIRKYENKQRTPSLEHIYQIAQTFHVPTFDISPFKSECLTSNFEEDIRYHKLITIYNSLNEKGQKKILEHLEMISKISDYLENEN